MKYLLIHDHIKRSAELNDCLSKIDDNARLYYASTQEEANAIFRENHISIVFASIRLWHTGWLQYFQGFAPPVILLQGRNTTIKGIILESYPLLIREPVKIKTLKEIIDKSVALNGRPDTNFITTYDGYEHIGIHATRIEYITYSNHYVGIHTETDAFTKRISLDKMIKQLSYWPFYAVNEGLAVSVSFLAAVKPGMHVIDRQIFEYSAAMKKEIDKITENW